MATAEQVLSLRLLVAEPDETTYPEETLSDRIDGAAGNLDRVAWEIWTEKTAALAMLADISEGGSSRSNGALHAKALEMVKLFKSRLDEAAGNTPGPGRSLRIHRLVR